MATTKVTITLDNTQLQEIRELVEKGRSSSISGFIKHAVAVSLHDAAGWKEMLEGALLATGGPLTKKERAWADALINPSRKRSRKKRAAA